MTTSPRAQGAVTTPVRRLGEQRVDQLGHRPTRQDRATDEAAFDQEAMAAYVAAFDAATVHASCEDYRAGLTCDLALDDESHEAGERIGSPLLVLWGARGLLERAYDVLAVWRDHAAAPDLVNGQALDCGHFLPEEAPEETAGALLGFLDAEHL